MSVLKFKRKTAIIGQASAVGGMEKNGPLGELFDVCDESDRFGQKTFEKAETEMLRQAFSLALRKTKTSPFDIEAVFAGDLMNQCTASSYAISTFGVPYIGLYGACSTAAEGLLLSACAIESGLFETVASCASSHNSTAERQFRFPLEYGGQRPPTAQWTATAAAAFVISAKEEGSEENVPLITEAMVGKIVDKGVTDQADMGGAMAPAAASTLYRYFEQSGARPEDFDLIVSGDLGEKGRAVCAELLKLRGIDLGARFTDCGLLLYDGNRQDTHSGGSGCGCSASVTAAYILPKIRAGEFKDVLLVGTGALMSPASVQQGLSIPGIAHLVRITGGKLTK